MLNDISKQYSHVGIKSLKKGKKTIVGILGLVHLSVPTIIQKCTNLQI
jgi:hypothetical protein